MFYPTEYKIPEFKSQVQILSKEFWFFAGIFDSVYIRILH